MQAGMNGAKNNHSEEMDRLSILLGRYAAYMIFTSINMQIKYFFL